MAAFMPAWRAFDDAHSVRVLSQRPFGGGSVALCVAPSLAGAKDGPRLALAMARRWVEQGREVILADGHIGRPSLHELAGVENKEGLAELLLVGADWHALAAPTSVRGLRLIPAGGHAAPSEPEAVRERLATLCRATEDAGQTLALFVPLGSMVAEWAVEECRDIIVLSTKGERTLHFFSADEDRIRARVGPPAKAAPPAEAPVAGQAAPAAAPAPSSPSPPPPASERASPPPPTEVEVPTPQELAREPAVEEAAPPPPSGSQEPELPLWDASEGFLTPREEEEPPPPSRRGRGGATSVEDSWAAYAAQLRATSDGGTRPPPGARPARYPAQPPPFPADSAPLSDTAPVIPPPPPPVSHPKPVVEPWEKEEPEEAEEHDELDELAVFEEMDDYMRPARDRRKLIVRVAAIAAVAVVGVAGGWIFTSLRNRPPVELEGVMPTRAPVATQRAAADPVAGEEGAGGTEATEAGPAQDAPASGAGTATTPSAGAPERTGPAETTPAVPAATEQSRAAAPAPTPGPGAPVGPAASAPHQRFTWSLAALGSYRTAAGMVDRLRQRAPGEVFAIAPIASEGRTLYRVLGGAAETRDALLATRESMARAAGLAPETPFPREAPMAYALSDYPDAGQAQARADALGRAGVPTYVLEVARDDGSRAYRLYAGAYASEAEAVPLLTLLRGAGVTDAVFGERRGRAIPR